MSTPSTLNMILKTTEECSYSSYTTKVDETFEQDMDCSPRPLHNKHINLGHTVRSLAFTGH